MKFGFVIDNRKCIGCHACTTACKSEHQVPVGVNRTWVKQVEKGIFPDTRRLFSVMRCNHCTDAPCVEICPVTALFVRDDGIVDFDNRRCIGCKSCMQACPYDALYIDPDTNTAAKCNYCAHRVDIGLEPACVNVCPEHAIISGDMDNPDSEISEILSRQQVSVRKSEKGTRPNLFYVDADQASLDPLETSKSSSYFWSAQARGVGHYAKEAEKMAFSNGDVVDAVMKNAAFDRKEHEKSAKAIEAVMGKEARRIYDTADKGILWGWEVSGYVWTKAISAGSILIPGIGDLAGWMPMSSEQWFFAIGTSIVFLLFTGILLVMDLDRPDRFLNVLLRPSWSSWLVRGGYAITIFGGLLVALGLTHFIEWYRFTNVILMATLVIAVVVAVYTAYLFAQAKGRDFWQSPTLALHMLVHSLMAGSVVFLIFSMIFSMQSEWIPYLSSALIATIVINLVTMGIELTTTHPTQLAAKTVSLITRGRYKNRFWWGVILAGNIIPLILMIIPGTMSAAVLIGAGVLVLVGIYITNDIWVESPQTLPLS